MNKCIYENGVYKISNEKYHASEGISRSMLMNFKRSPYHFWHEHLSGLTIREEATPAMNLGSAVHTLVLEGGLFNHEFFVCSQKTRPARGTSSHEKMIEEANGRIILTPSERDLAINMAHVVLTDTNCNKLLADCNIEESIYFTHKSTGLQCKARPDAWLNGLVIDLKTTADASMRTFQNSAMHFGYFLQAAFAYRALESIGITMEQFVCIPVEKSAPFCVGVYMIDNDALEYGLNQFDILMEGLARCLEEDNFPGYGVKSLSLPGWAKYDDSLEIE